MMNKVLIFLTMLLMQIPLFAQANTKIDIFESDRSESPTTRQFNFTLPPYPAEQQVLLGLDARIDWRTLAGSNPWMRVAVNGNFLTKSDLHNKTNNFKTKNGVELTWSSRDRWRVLYSPDFTAARSLIKEEWAVTETDPYRLVWDVTPYAKPGVNSLEIVNLQILQKPTTLVLRNANVTIGNPIPPPLDPTTIVTPAPKGPLPLFMNNPSPQVPLRVHAGQGLIQLDANTQNFKITTRTSLPEGRWQEAQESNQAKAIVNGQSSRVSWATPLYTVQRQIEVKSNHIQVRDTYSNRTNELIGIIVENQLHYPSKPNRVRIAGVEAPDGEVQKNNSYNPSVYAEWEKVAVGMVAEDDVYRAHLKNLHNANGMALVDDRLGIDANQSVTLEWSIYPVIRQSATGDSYWDFINTVRRDWGVNFAIPGPFSFTMAFNRDTKSRDAKWYEQWIRSRDLKIVSGGIAKYKDGTYAHGTGILYAPEFVAAEKDWVGKIHQATPDVKVCSYFHAQITTEPGAEQKFAAERLQDLKGDPMSYPGRHALPIFLPTRDNSYGKALWGYIRTCIDTIGADGLYWDEMSHSLIQFAGNAPWDGHSVLIDANSHKVKQKISNVSLLMQPLKMDIINYLSQHKKHLMANTQASTRTMTQQKIVRFVETISSFSAISNTHLGCPLALGNHMSDESTPAASARNVREILKRGAVYYGWAYNRDAAPWNFTSVMYPITPEALGPGYVIGKERIHTTVSGRFGFSDGKAATVYVVDAGGALAKDADVKEIKENNQYSYEIRIPSDQFAIIVKNER